MAKNLVSFVVLNWNGIDDTLKCLDSIRAQTHAPFEIIVVDNGSPQEQKDHLKTIDDIILIDLPVNTGFTGGQIAAFKQAKGNYIALINNDSVIAIDWCDKALQQMKSGKVGAVGGRAYTWNVENGEKPFITSNPYYSYQVVHPTSGHTKTLRTGSHVASVNAISGSAVLISRKVVEQVGYFDNRFFAYYEETDLFARMKRAGYKIIYTPEAHTWHKIAQSTKSKPGFYLYHMHRNRFMFAVKNFDRRYLLAFYRIYAHEWCRALASLIKHRSRTQTEQRMMVRAGLWNLAHLPLTLLERRRTKKLGKTYSSLLATDALEDISIVIPCYNYAAFVEEAITSAAEQTLPPCEIIIIDDHSTDSSVEVINKTVSKLSKKHPFIDFMVIVKEKNKGVIDSKNVGLEKVRAWWTVFLDADDILDRAYLEKCATAQRKHDADVVYTDMHMFGAVDIIQTVLPFSKYRLRAGNYIHNSALFSTPLLRRVGGYNPEFHMGFEDWELNLRLSRLTDKFYYLPEPLLNYRRHDGASRDNNAQQKLAVVVKLLETLYPDQYNLRYYWWLETTRLSGYIKGILRFPLLVSKHTYYHTIMGLDRRAKHHTLLRRFLSALRIMKGKKK